MKSTWKKICHYVISILIALAVGVASAFATYGKMEEYAKLNLPPLSPPGWLFPIVWTVLFILMGISAAIVWKSGSTERGDALFIYGTQLIVNFMWSIFYFDFNARLLAFFWLLFLLMLVILMTVRFNKISTAAAKLQIPYIVWLVFAGYLNLATYILNK
jgi:tryptophan-rich sensory protein